MVAGLKLTLAARICVLALLAVCALTVSGTRAAEDSETSGGRLEIEVEALPETPYEQEMVLLTIRGFYPYTIALSELKQPAFRNFGWMQLGRDRWFEVQGQQMRGFERIMAVFPQRAGRLTIEPFVHHLTLVTSGGQRIPHDVASEPVSIEVRPKPAAAGWWFPARGARVADGWDVPPDQLGPGQAAVRTVTLEADGIGPELLPPIPNMRSPNLIVFADPGERSTTLTPQGPVSRVIWRWTVKPATSAVTELEAITIPWFDTAARQNREIVLAPQRIALAGSTLELREPDEALQNFVAFAPPAGLLFGFLAGLALLLPGLRLRSREELARMFRRLMPDRDVWALRRAAWRRDAARVRLISNLLIRRDFEEGRSAVLSPDVQTGLRMLDTSLYGAAHGPNPPLNLRSFVRRFLRARR
jgi:hypothetical protein